MTILLQGHVALDRIVWTYLPDGQPLGLITGYDDGEGGFVAEQIVRWAGSLSAMLRAGLEEAWAHRFQHVILMIPSLHAKAEALTLLALRMGFEDYARNDEAAWFVRYRP